jgi:hypothetical protein
MGEPKMDDFVDDPRIAVDSIDLVVFEFPEYSIVFDLLADDIWAEFPDDERDEIEIAFNGEISDESLALLPDITDPESGEKKKLDRVMLGDLRSKAVAAQDAPAYIS